MTDSNDVSRLFKQIGVSGADYQEINKQNGARDSQSRWPLLNSLHAQANRAPEVDVRRRYDMDSDTTGAQSAAAPADDALFTHIATDDIVQAHEQATISVIQAGDVDRRATNAAMAAVDAAPAPAETTPDTPVARKTAEFIAPRANLLGGHLRPSAHRAPFDPAAVEGPVTPHAAPMPPAAASGSPAPSPMPAPISVAPAPTPAAPAATLAQRLFTAARTLSGAGPAPAAPITRATASATPVYAVPAAPAPVASAPVAPAPVASAPVASAPVASAPVASAPVASAPVASAPIAHAPVASAPVASAPHAWTAARPLAEAALPSSTASVSAQAQAAGSRAASQPTAAPAAVGGLFARLALPEAPPADEPTEPVAQAAPVSLFDRLIRS